MPRVNPPRENTFEPTVVHDRKVLLRARQHEIRRVAERACRPQRTKVGKHCAADRNASERRFHLNHARLLSAPIHTNRAMKISIGLPCRPRKPNRIAMP